jgi:hypothetical protein
VIRRARAEFDARRPDPEALTNLANAVLATLPVRGERFDQTDRPVVADQLAAAVEYLDATARVAPELIDIETVLRMISTVEFATQLLRSDDSLTVDGQHLSAAASIALLMGRPALGEADSQSREVLVLEARRLLRRLEEQSNRDAVMTTEDIWNIRVVMMPWIWPRSRTADHG